MGGILMRLVTGGGRIASKIAKGVHADLGLRRSCPRDGDRLLEEIVDRSRDESLSPNAMRSSSAPGTNARYSPLGIAALSLFTAALALSTTALASDTGDKRIALSNNYAGNSWRQAMLQSWTKVGKQAVADKTVSAADAFTTADKEAPTQAAQIQNLILQGYNAIVIDSGSPEALNGAVKKACDAGVTVVSFDGIVTEPCAWRITVDLQNEYGAEEVRQIAKRLPKGGNLLQIRGLAGTSIDEDINKGMLAELKKHPNLKIVNTVYGNWDETTAQKAVATVLPSLPEIAAVLDEGGDGYGAAQAFRAAGRKTPLIMLGNRQDELQWWKEQRVANHYDTWSGSEAPGMCTYAFWVAQQILSGKKVPHDLLMKILVIDPAKLDEMVKSTPAGGVANAEYTQAEVVKAIDGTH
jgi:ribose transport system substrate-binding protein